MPSRMLPTFVAAVALALLTALAIAMLASPPLATGGHLAALSGQAVDSK
jgi:hypothetical protein